LRSFAAYFVLLLILLYSLTTNAGKIPKLHSGLSFKENKGQVGDQFSKPRPDVLFTGHSQNLTFHLRNNGISYQMNRVDSWIKVDDQGATKGERAREIPAQQTIYRLDINWINVNSKTSVVKEDPIEGYENYYSELCPNGVTGVKSYKAITYKDLYEGIDLKWYQKDGNLKYDYIISPGTDYKQIQLEIDGAENIFLNKNGELNIKTPLGTITEKAPLATQNGKKINAKWKVVKNIVLFEISNIDPSLPLVIDPLVRLWGTYYGGSADDAFYHCKIDASGNIYVTGYSDSQTNIATVGSHQFISGGGPSGSWEDAILIKFNSAGTRLWGTYYGGAGSETGYSCDINSNGNLIVMSGSTSTTLTGVIATPGTHQANYGGNTSLPAGDAYLAVFDSSGVRQWGTYYGGSSNEWGYHCAFDINGNIYLSGVTSSSNSISSPGSHQPISGGGYDCFLAKFNNTGTLQWGTYYGGNAYEGIGRCAPDAAGNIYLVGNSKSNSGITSSGAYQVNYGGAAGSLGDAFIAKFNSSGTRSWGTYYGGGGDDAATGCAIGADGSVYISGQTTAGSQTMISTSGAHQTQFGGGGYDGFLLKLTPGGTRMWCTLYGGKGDETDSQIVIDPFGFIYLSGVTTSTNAISTPGTFQENYAGSYDSYLAKFNSNGQRFWGTYYGGPVYDDYCIAAADPIGNVFLAGWTNSGIGISTPDSQQPVFAGGTGDGYLVKFDGCIPAAPVNITSSASMTICKGDSTILTAQKMCSLTWFDVPVGGTALAIDSIFVTPILTNNSTFYVSETSCGTDSLRTAITVTVTSPSLTINVDPKVLCYKSSVEAFVTGALSYTWYPDQWISCTTCTNPILSPLETKEYCVDGSDANSCISRTCTTIEVNFAGDHNFSLPNAFTPNGDGLNDSFCLQGWNVCNAEFKIMIFDRWGEKVFESGDPAFCWNGIFKGQLLNSDVYVYSVAAKYKDQTEVNKKGNITLIR
jgi:gliding motility-associated-like protein